MMIKFKTIFMVVILVLSSAFAAAKPRSKENCGRIDLATDAKVYPPGTKLYWIGYKLEFTKESKEEGVQFVAFQTPNRNMKDDEILKLIKKRNGDVVTILNGPTLDNLADAEYQTKQCDDWIREVNSASPGSTAK